MEYFERRRKKRSLGSGTYDQAPGTSAHSAKRLKQPLSGREDLVLPSVTMAAAIKIPYVSHLLRLFTHFSIAYGSPRFAL